ncbi:MAG: hypothetical protein HOQ32_12670 [Lysobacter sp.]|nr:hypothetical protein [Lysobacter sp.]
MNLLFLMNLQVGRGSNREMPSHLVGAFVPVYVAASDHEAALVQAVAQVQALGYEFLDLHDGVVHQLDPMQWQRYVSQAWPEFPNHFPSQAEVLAGLAAPEWVFFGPFAAYEAERPN